MNCKNAAIIFIFFIIFSFCILCLPSITSIDVQCIKYIQTLFADVNSQIPIIMGGTVFYVMTIIPLFIVSCYFYLKKLYRKIFLYCSVPFIAYFVNSVIKIITDRPRPPIELQIEEHMSSSSYVSRHTFVSACIYLLFIYLVCTYCKNKVLRFFLILVSLLWILFEGFSRIWLGVHHPSDVIGAFILSIPFVIVYIRIFQKSNS